MKRRLIPQFLSLALLAGVLAFSGLTYKKYGMFADEPSLTFIANMNMTYFRVFWRSITDEQDRKHNPKFLQHVYSILSNQDAILHGYRIYGPIFEIPAELFAKAIGGDPYDGRHLFVMLTGIVGMVAAWKIANALGGPVAGFMAILMMCLYPSYFGHMVNNSKDVPFAVGYLWSLYFMVKIFLELPKISVGNFIAFGIATGCTAGIRVGAFVIYAVITLAWLAYFAAGWKVRSRATVGELVRISAYLVVSFLVAYLVMFLVWPNAQIRPIQGPITTLQAFSNWGGEIMRDQWYLFRAIKAKLPEFMFVGIITGIVAVISSRQFVVGVIRDAEGSQRGRFCAYLLLVLSTVFPIVYVIAKRSILYNEMRQMLFSAVPVVVMSALTFTWVLKRCDGNRWKLAAFAVVTSLLFLQPAIAMARLYPYHYTYGNFLFGDRKESRDNGFTDEYWLHSYRQLAYETLDYLKETEGADFGKTRRKIFVWGPTTTFECFSHYIPAEANIEILHSNYGADLGAYEPYYMTDQRGGIIVRKVGRAGKTFSVLKDYRRES
jgi:hypothetical protein